MKYPRTIRRGLSVALIALLLVMIGLGMALAVYSSAFRLSSAAAAQPVVQFLDAYAKFSQDANGTIFIRAHNIGSGVLRVVNLTITDRNGLPYVISFVYGGGQAVTDRPSCEAVCSDRASLAGSDGVGVSPAGYLAVPAGGEWSVTLRFDAAKPENRLAQLFEAGNTYAGFLDQYAGASIPFQLVAQPLQ